MKRIALTVLTLTLLLPLLMSGCAVFEPATTSKSPANGGTPTQTLSLMITADDFAADPNPVRDVTLDLSDSFTVTVPANPTTGYSWTENATISAPVVTQLSYQYVEPVSGLAGAPGNAVWVFQGAQTGTGSITVSYARPWESVPPTWTMTINVTVQ